ncbi:hypothetical protein [Robertkochia sediminum]|uniref:hypothetical protein n=1 Tax=Robertkochia sediminum TaxID=2785326 RepID=UPI0019314FD2|nr:hypothetical protein [Robertkochia sediminum]MBL7472979.1 hypothetical protein [Robertkochia sediminum]
MRSLTLFIFTCILSTFAGLAQQKGYEIVGDSVIFTFDLNDYERYTNETNGQRTSPDDLEVDDVYLAGEFNDWSREGWKMTRISESRFRLAKALSQLSGRVDWQFKYLVNSSFWAEPDTSFENITASEQSNFWRSVYNLNLHTIAPDPNGNTTFFLEGYHDAEQVILSGSFNKWHPEALEMQKTKEGWTLTLNLAPGTYTYKYVVDDEWIHDPGNPEKTLNEYGGNNSVITIKASTSFSLSGFGNANTVCLAGSFNNWNPTSIPMEKNGDQWKTCIDLRGGKHHYKFIVDGTWITDPNNDIKEYDADGNLNSVIMIK